MPETYGPGLRAAQPVRRFTSGCARQLAAAYSILRVVRLVIEGCPSLVVDDQNALALIQQARGGCGRLSDQRVDLRGTLPGVACTH
jgi:hypothetical protein